MSLRVYTKNSKEKLKLVPKPFASGGEGHLYKIASPHAWQKHVVKIYHPAKRTATREEKMRYLLRNPPQQLEQDSIVWIKDMVYSEQNEFLGFIMPMVKGEKLEILCTPKLPKKLTNTWYRFHPEADDALDLRLKVCYNLAAAIHQIHACKHYILVDLKPDNVIITPEGLLALVDLDSVEVVENGIKLFDAPVATPEYTPPEYYRANEHDPTQQQAWDRFSLAVIFYKLLLGIHPFAGSFTPPYDKANTLSQKIEAGLFVHHPKRQDYRKSIPPLHRNFFKLSNELQHLFHNCFVEGSVHPHARPTAHEWCSAIMQHLDIHKTRLLPSKVVTLPTRYTDIEHLQEKGMTADSFLAKHPIKSDDLTVFNIPHPQKQQSKIRLRDFNLLLLITVIIFFAVYYVEEGTVNPTKAIIILVTYSIVSSALFLFSLGVKNNTLHLRTAKDEFLKSKHFFEKQQKIYDGIKIHIENFLSRLNAEHHRLFASASQQKPADIKQAVQFELQQLNQVLQQQDKAAQQLIDSENYEYQALKDKYNKLLHTHPNFVESQSLDLELSAIDFALQEQMERLQKTLGRELKSTQLEYDQILEKNDRQLQKVTREINKKIGQYRKHLEQAEKQEKRKYLTKMKRQLALHAANVTEGAKTRLTLFKKEILNFLQQHNITNMNQIKDIKPPGLVTLKDGRVVSIAPLRYYQIHELLEWWLSVYQERVELPADVVQGLEERFAKDLRAYKEKAHAELAKHTETAQKKAKSIKAEALSVYKRLREQNEPQIVAIKTQFDATKKFLEKLFDERKIEEQRIHKRYQKEFDEIVVETQKKADHTNQRIQQICQIEALDQDKIVLYKNNLNKYRLGLDRLLEEKKRLEELDQRLQIAEKALEANAMTSVQDHFKEFFYLK